MINLNQFNTLEEIYSAIQFSSEKTDSAYSLLSLRNFYINLCSFDHKTGEALYSDFENLTNRINYYNFNENKKDYLDKIIDHSYYAIKYILLNPREKILREHQVIPIYATREVDNASVQWLSQRSGRNLREKLAEKPYIKAVKRRFTYDTIENRLFKDYLIKLKILLITKSDANQLKQSNSIELLELIERWLNTNEVKEIANWQHVPPNNTLLQDKHYRKVWDAWLFIQNLDDTIVNDSHNIKQNYLTIISWILISTLNNYKEMRFLQQPIFFDYNNFSINSLHMIHGILYFDDMKQPIQLTQNDKFFKLRIGNKISIEVNIVNNKLFFKSNNKLSTYDLDFNVFIDIQKDFKNLLKEKYLLIENQIIDFNKIESDHMVLDLNTLYPRIITSQDKQITVPSRFVTQYWTDTKNNLMTIDCSTAKALLLSPSITTVSMLNLFSKNMMDKSSIFSGTLNKFTKDISSHIESDTLSYLISDRINDFTSEKLRKSMNYAFDNVYPLPRSVASVFYFQLTDEFIKTKFENDDNIIVIEATPDHISATKLLIKHNIEVETNIKETRGITWVRHPSININSSIPKENFKSILNTTLNDEITNIWGKDGAKGEADSFTWVSDKGNWFTYKNPSKIKSIQIDFREVKKSLNLNNKHKLKVIVIGEYANELKLLNYMPQPLNLQDKLLYGANQLNQWQKVIPEISLWEDYLPELSFNIKKGGRYQDLYLVKDTTIIPLNGKRTEIIISEYFELKKAKDYYEFPLQLDNGDKELQFMASLRSSNLPLKKDVTCKLKMIYTYGADDPYELYFIPKYNDDLRIFKSIKVEWKKINNNIVKETPIPDFPKRYEWKDFESFYNQKNNRYDNLLSNIESNIHKIIDLEIFLSGENIYSKGNRVSCDLSDANWSQAGNGDWFCRFVPDGNNEIFIHQDNYINFSKDYTKVSFDIIEKRGGLIADNITKGKTLSRHFDADRIKRNIKFSMTTVWNQAHSLSDFDIPINFKQTMEVGIESSISLLNNKDTDSNLERLLIFYLSFFHKDTPSIVMKKLLNYSNEGTHNNEVSYVIGNGYLDWQKSIFINSIYLTNSFKSIEILSKSLWRTKVLIYELSLDDINEISKKIILNLKNENIGPLTLTQNLEVLLALLRTRGSEDKIVNQIFALNSKITILFIDIIEKITNKVFDENIKIKTRITFNLSKPKSLDKTPDLLYALRLYLTGDDGANSIEVTEVSDE